MVKEPNLQKWFLAKEIGIPPPKKKKNLMGPLWSS